MEKKTKNKKTSHSAKQLEREDPLGFLKLQFAAKYYENLKRGPLATKKIEKKSHSAKKIQRGDLIVSSGFVSCVKKGVNCRGQFALT